MYGSFGSWFGKGVNMGKEEEERKKSETFMNPPGRRDFLIQISQKPDDWLFILILMRIVADFRLPFHLSTVLGPSFVVHNYASYECRVLYRPITK